jgi:2'-hydroxyisoflavone reductase
MDILILGGTNFLGPHLVEAAQARGHRLTLFNRGRRALFPDVEKIRGDRNSDLALLQIRHWDAAIDTSGYLPRSVRLSTEALAHAIERYIFISTISVYADFSRPGMDESAPLATLTDTSVEEVTNETYGGLKVLCEQAVEQALPGRALLIRPGFIVGPGDVTDRFTYWPYRVAQGGEMLVPGEPGQRLQFIDARDLAAWIISMIEERQVGTYNATGPDYPLTMGRLLEECQIVTGRNDLRPIWVDEKFLLQREVYPPLWAPAEEAGAHAVDCSKALRAGLTFRPLADTIRATLAWKNGGELIAGLKPDQEKQLLQQWRAEDHA